MGAYQSKLSPEEQLHEKAVLERLRSFEAAEESSEDEFVHVVDENIPDPRLNREVEGLPVQLMSTWQDELLEDPKNRLALSALSTADPQLVLASRSVQIADQQVFNVQIPFEGAPITNQRSSGRCWLFAATNVFRIALMKKYNLDSFELSQAYLFFWDKLEKANYFLENIIDLADEDLDSRLVQRVLADPVSDGGQWDMVYNLVEKYGLVPQVLYPDSWNAMNSAKLNYLVRAKLREHAVTLRRMLRSGGAATAATLAATKQRMLREIHLILTLTLGPPPNPDGRFAWSFVDAGGRARTVDGLTPRAFARDIASPQFRALAGGFGAIAGMVSLVHDPRNAPLTRLTVDRLGNVAGGRGVTYVNVGMATLRTACVAMLRAGLPVFFGSDVGKFSNRDAGVMDLGIVDYTLGFNVDLLGAHGLNKADRLRVGESAMTHAMVLTAVHVDASDHPVRWRVQNSWGTDVGDKGWFVMSDRWMDEFVYQAVVDQRFLVKEVRDVLKKEPIVLPLWDPMGSLA